MKKVLLVLITIFYLSLSFIYLNFHFKYSIEKFIHNNVYEVFVKGSSEGVNANLELEKISMVAKSDNLNIFKTTYSPTGDVNLYFAVGNENDFINNFKVKLFKGKNIKDLTGENFISNKITTSKNQIGNINILQSKNINIYSLKAMNHEPIVGTYFIEGKSNINELISQFKSVGLIVSDNLPMYMHISPINCINISLLLGMIMLLAMVIISYLYYLVSQFKEVSIKSLFGYNSIEIFKEVIFFAIKSISIAIVITLIIQAIYILSFYNSLGIFEYFIELFIFLLITSIFILIVFLISLIIFKFNNKVDMLKNKKPVGQLQILNYTAKVISSFILVFILINTYTSFNFLSHEVKELAKWNETKEYCYFMYNYNPMNREETCLFNDKNKILFSKLNEDGLLVYPSNGIQYGVNGYDEKSVPRDFGQGTSMYSGNSIEVNSNYLKLNPIYYENGERVQIKNNYGDYMIILVPEMYKKYEKELIKNYTKWYQFRRYANINIYDQTTGKKIPYEKPVKVEIRFIKNNQRTFLYNPDFNVKNDGYSVNSCIAIIDSENIGADSYMAYMNGGYFFANIKEGYKNLDENIEKAGLSQDIGAKVNLYSRVSGIMFRLKNNLEDNIFIIISILLLQVFIIIFSVLNYTEKNKLDISIKKIHGYSFFNISYKFLLGIIINWIVVMFGVMATHIPFEYAVIPSLVLMILDIILSLFIMSILNRNVLKNVLNKE